MKLLAVLLTLLPASLMARTMECVDLTGYWSVDVIVVTDNGGTDITVTPKPQTNFRLRVLHGQTTDNSMDNDRFTIVMTILEDSPAVYVPTTWLVDWETPGLAHTAFYEGDWLTNDQFDCTIRAIS